MRTLAIETAGAACSIALLDDGAMVAERHEAVGRGHAEHLIRWIAALPGGGRADRVVVGCGPGSFTGVRIGIAAARGLALGWGVRVSGVSSLALVAAGCDADHFVVAVEGGHGELLVQSYRRDPLRALSPFVCVTPERAAALMRVEIVVGSGAERLVAARGFGTAVATEARAANLLGIPSELVSLPPQPIYGRAPDAKPMPIAQPCAIRRASASDLDTVMAIMDEAFDPLYGEAWTASQCAAMLIIPGSWLLLATVGGEPAGFALIRSGAGEAELLLIAIRPCFQGRNVGRALLDQMIADCTSAGIDTVHLEVRADNPALGFYARQGFAEVGLRKNYYHGRFGRVTNAVTLTRRIS